MNLHDEICKLAYELFERSGRCEGRDAENWLEAERIVRARYEMVAVPEPVAAPKAQKAPAKTAPKKTETAKAEPKAPKTKAAPKAKKAAKTT